MKYLEAEPLFEDAAETALEPLRPMTRQEAEASIAAVKCNFAKSKEHLAIARRELLQQHDRGAWQVLGFETFADLAKNRYKPDYSATPKF
jgi:hypothetical protein